MIWRAIRGDFMRGPWYFVSKTLIVLQRLGHFEPFPQALKLCGSLRSPEPSDEKALFFFPGKGKSIIKWSLPFPLLFKGLTIASMILNV
jgi:hypothetical protein